MIAKLAYGQLPHWARPTHPIMRSILGYGNPPGWRLRLLRLLMVGLAVALLLTFGYISAQENTGDDPPLRDVLYGPLVFTQTIAIVMALLLTANVIAVERQKQTWDSLKLTTAGASLTLRARWIAVFFRLRWLLFIILIGRLAYVGVMLDDLTDFQGRALDLYISGIIPEVSLNAAILLMAAFITGFVLQPFIAVAFAGALGLLLAVATRARSVVILGLLMLVAIRVILSIVALAVDDTVYDSAFEMTQSEAWTRLLITALEGDMSLRLFHLETLGQVWADVENTIYIGGVILGILLVQAALANGLVLVATWLAARPASN